MRKMARVVKVDSIEPIENAHSVEVAVIGGWKAVTGKGQFQPGDLGVFFEIDSLVPMSDRYKFLDGKCSVRTMNGVNGYWIKTKKLFKGSVVSQGLLIPLSEFPEITEHSIDMDVTELLGVALYEPQINSAMGGEARGNWPAGIPKTDQERVQNRWPRLPRA